MSKFSRGGRIDATLYLADSLYAEGVKSLKDSPKRVEATRRALEVAGGKLKAIYWTFGQYDAVAIGEFPDDETGLRVGLAGAMQGYVRGETLRALTEEEFRKAISSVS